MGLLFGDVEHGGEVASGSAENEEVPEFVGGEFSGPEFGAFCSVDDGADGVGESSGGDPSDGGGGHDFDKLSEDGNEHPSHAEVEGESEPGGGFFASGGHDNTKNCQCPLEGEDDVAFGFGEGKEADGGV